MARGLGSSRLCGPILWPFLERWTRSWWPGRLCKALLLGRVLPKDIEAVVAQRRWFLAAPQVSPTWAATMRIVCEVITLPLLKDRGSETLNYINKQDTGPRLIDPLLPHVCCVCNNSTVSPDHLGT